MPLLDTLQSERPERTLAFFMRRIGEDDDLQHCQRLVNSFCSSLRTELDLD